MFLLVCVSQLVFGMWMASRGFFHGDAISRAAGALFALHSVSPQLSAIGLVWMPLPAFIELLWAAFYPLWPGVVSSGFASVFTTALAGGLTATILLGTARAMGLPEGYGWLYALFVSLNPMLFLYGANGMSEGVAAPFLTGAVCCLVLFWYSGRRRYVAAAAVALALGFASLYEAVLFGAALFAALALGVLFGSEAEASAPRGRWIAVQGLGLLLTVPSVFVAASWLVANAAIMGDPWYFARSQYSNAGYIAGLSEQGILAAKVWGDPLGSLRFVAVRAAPFMLPGAFLLLVRALDGRFFRMSTVSLSVLLASVPFGLMLPMTYAGATFGWLRYFVYPLFVAAGWGLYEVVQSQHRRRAALLVLLGWLVAAPPVLLAMSDGRLGQEEHHVVRAALTGEHARGAGLQSGETLTLETPVARRIDGLPEGSKVAMDSVRGWAVASQVSPETLKHGILMPFHEGFRKAVREPSARGVTHFLVPNPETQPGDYIARHRPGLYYGNTPGFELVERFPDTPEQWRLFRVVSEEDRR